MWDNLMHVLNELNKILENHTVV